MTWQTWVCSPYSWYIRTIISSIPSSWPVSVFQLLMEPVDYESTPLIRYVRSEIFPNEPVFIEKKKRKRLPNGAVFFLDKKSVERTSRKVGACINKRFVGVATSF